MTSSLLNGWRVCGASVRGTSHSRNELPCQDAHEARLLVGNVLVVAVSDGAGSAARAEEGSRVACDAAVTHVAEHLAVEGQIDAASAPQLVTDSFTVARGRLEELTQPGTSALRDFACTLLIAVLHPDWSCFGQVGDGAIVVSAHPGPDWSWIFWPERGEYANTTRFLTEDDASDHVTVRAVSDRIDDVALFTDGLQGLVLHYASQTVHSPFFERMLAPVRALDDPGVDDSLGGALQAYLSSPTVAERTDDDVTLVLGSRRGV